MDEDLRNLHETMVFKDRLRMLADLQATYQGELLSRGFEPEIAEQLMLEWSRSAFSMTFRSIPEPQLDEQLDELLGDPDAPAIGAQPSLGTDPSSVPPGESWLQLVQDLDLSDDDSDERAA